MRCGDRGEGRWLLVCRGLAAFDGKKRHSRGSGWQPFSLSLSLFYLSRPVIAVDCRGRGIVSAGLSDGCLLHVGTYTRAHTCVRHGCRCSNEVKVQMRLFVISIQSKGENTNRRRGAALGAGFSPTPLHNLVPQKPHLRRINRNHLYLDNQNWPCRVFSFLHSNNWADRLLDRQVAVPLLDQ